MGRGTLGEVLNHGPWKRCADLVEIHYVHLLKYAHEANDNVMVLQTAERVIRITISFADLALIDNLTNGWGLNGHTPPSALPRCGLMNLPVAHVDSSYGGP
ncbi:hypothetical protein SPBR_05378 [Sporothrix brasiliensis 5110]|uniref:Uncharacterized protein n=1 Tax=Sporothrix brasiliensis 5110 TaxID=1398154 RepID=A0A0C2ICK5_9PEZI|nr:uncharacterized protein SPBR_05378 [Sporothrix brasiliensis 5110]KIH87041.1 hypothetical protein SPBR_05378 [Sporothrix brasiliensis 5110]